MTAQSGIVEDFFNTSIPLEVWHYTSLHGLEGILSTNSIWATEAHFTKDESEFVHARQIAVEFLETISPVDDHIAAAKHTTLRIVKDAFDEGALSKAKTEVYLASFSAAKDSKSQWYEFADGAHGVSLAFDLRDVRPLKDLRLGVTLAPCVYRHEEKIKLLEAATINLLKSLEVFNRQVQDRQWILGKWRDWLRERRQHRLPLSRPAFEAELKDELRASSYHAYTSAVFDLLRLASHCKDSSFDQEKEWRLALPRSKNKPLTHNRIEYRGPQRNIPYLAFNLFRSGGRLPITRIMAGPLCKDHRMIRQILDHSGYNVPICESRIPLRDRLESFGG